MASELICCSCVAKQATPPPHPPRTFGARHTAVQRTYKPVPSVYVSNQLCYNTTIVLFTAQMVCACLFIVWWRWSMCVVHSTLPSVSADVRVVVSHHSLGDSTTCTVCQFNVLNWDLSVNGSCGQFKISHAVYADIVDPGEMVNCSTGAQSWGEEEESEDNNWVNLFSPTLETSSERS